MSLIFGLLTPQLTHQPTRRPLLSEISSKQLTRLAVAIGSLPG